MIIASRNEESPDVAEVKHVFYRIIGFLCFLLAESPITLLSPMDALESIFSNFDETSP